MRTAQNKQTPETVLVMARGKVLDSASFPNGHEAEAYKRNVRRWAFNKGVCVEVWSHKADVAPRRSFVSPRALLACAG